MNENKKKRREWVKTAAIVFLSVMLVLTFFSNTIMNYSLPEVAAQYVQSGSITAKIRGTGVVESGDPYEINVTETRKVSSVAVKVGDQVQKGDVLVYLEGKESDELKAAKEELEAAQDNYEKALLKSDVNTQIIQNAGSNISIDTYRQQITAAQAEEAQAQTDVNTWKEQYNKVSNHISILTNEVADTETQEKALREAENAKFAAEIALKEAESNLAYINDRLANYGVGNNTDVSDGDVSDGDVSTGDVSSNDAIVEALLKEQQAAKEDVSNKKNDFEKAEIAYEKAEQALNNKIESSDQTPSINALKRELNIIDINLKAAEAALAEKQAKLTELTGDIEITLAIRDEYEKILDAQEKVAEQEAKAIGGTVVADIAGTVTSINVIAGNNVSADTPVAVLQPEGKGYTMSFSVTNEQAKRLAVGDVADLVNSWRYEDVVVTLASIKPDPAEPGQKKKLTFDVTGSIVAGQTLNVSVGQKSANFDLIVPNSAIREDNNGKFVLTVESKSSPLGNRYVATRVDVEVLASDDTQSAISGALYGYEFIITTSNKPVEAGQLIRLPE